MHIHDPQADSDEAVEHYGLSLTKWDQLPKANAIVLAVAHREYVAMQIEALTASLQPGGCVIDVKSVLSRGKLPRADLRFGGCRVKTSQYVEANGAITPSPSILAGRAARCIGQSFNGRGACAAKSPFHPLPRGEREV